MSYTLAKGVYSVYRRTLSNFVTHSDQVTSDIGIWFQNTNCDKLRLAAAKVARHVCRCVLDLKVGIGNRSQSYVIKPSTH